MYQRGPKLDSLTRTAFICMYWIETLKFSARLACHEAHVGDEEGAKAVLVRAQVPHSGHLVVHLLVGQQDQRALPDAPRAFRSR